jgi:hypothetical protein
MWQLDDKTKYVLIHSFEFPRALTWGGESDRSHREYIRSQAVKNFPTNIPIVKAWAFRIYVWKSTKQRSFDIGNVPKLIIDAFCKKQIQADEKKDPQLKYTELGLFEEDTIDYVRIVEVAGERSHEERK